MRLSTSAAPKLAAVLAVLLTACSDTDRLVASKSSGPEFSQTAANGGPVANDDFVNAEAILAFPFSDVVDLNAASLELDERQPFCAFGATDKTVWYALTPNESRWVLASVSNAFFSTAITVYTGTALADLNPVACGAFGEKVIVEAQANTTYYLQVGNIFGGGSLEFHVEEILAPPNDAFLGATSISALPFDDVVHLVAAGVEPEEPASACGFVNRSAWYRFTPTETGSISAFTFNAGAPHVVAAYRGSDLGNLIELSCGSFGGKATFRAEAGVTYYFLLGTPLITSFPLTFRLEVTPPPVANFGFFPSDPSRFDAVQFFDFSGDPGGLGIASQEWRFGDGASAAGCCPSHTYAADGSYTTQLTVTTPDGRTASMSQTVVVKTHDVAITRFSAPTSASAGQTRRITVGLNSKRYPETVEVQLFKSVPGGSQFVGSLTQAVPVRASNRTTDFSFSYTFSNADAQLGKVTFRAVAVVVGARDALPADNEAIAPPTKISR